MKVGDRVKFVGPEYVHAGGPKIGQLGTITERAGHFAQAVGEAKEELVTVKFDGDEKASVVNLNRLQDDLPETMTIKEKDEPSQADLDFMRSVHERKP